MSEFAERVRRYYTLVDANDVPGIAALFAPDAVYRRPGYEPMVGRDSIRAFFGGERVIADGRHEITELVEGDGAVAVRGTFEGTLEDGSAATAEFADFFTPSPDGLFRRRTSYFHVPLL